MEITGKIKIKRKYNNSLKRKIFIAAVLIFPMTIFAVFTIYANFGGIFISMQKLENYKETFVGFENYRTFFERFELDNMDNIIATSFMYLPVILFILVPLTLFFSFFFYKKVPFTKISLVLLFMPNIIPQAVMAEFYRRMWDAGGGVIPSGLFTQIFSFISGKELNWLVSYEYANFALFIYTVWFGFGTNSLLIWGAMSRIPEELVESASLDGANLFREFFSITVPCIWPTLSLVLLIYLLSPFTIFTQPLMLAENGKYGTTTIQLYILNEIKKPNPYYAAACSIMVACITIPLSVIIRKLMNRMFSVVEI